MKFKRKAPSNDIDGTSSKKGMRPPTKYIRFKTQYIQEHKEEFGYDFNQMNEVAAKVWREMTEEEKEPYRLAYEDDMAKYNACQYIPNKRKKKTKEPKETNISRDTRVTTMPVGKFFDVVSTFDGRKREAVKEMGFGKLLELQCHHLNQNLCRYLVGQFDTTSVQLRICEEHSIHLTPEDVQSILGIPCGELEVCSIGEEYGQWAVDGGYIWKDALRVSKLEHRLKTVDAGDEFKRLFILFACACVLLPNTRHEAMKMVLTKLDDVDKIPSYNWGQAVIDFLVGSINVFRRSGSQQCNGCLLLLQMFYLVRVDGSGPKPESDAHLAASWTDALIKERLCFELNQLGAFGRGQIHLAVNEKEESHSFPDSPIIDGPTNYHSDSEIEQIIDQFRRELEMVEAVLKNMKGNFIKLETLLGRKRKKTRVAIEVRNEGNQEQRHVEMDMVQEQQQRHGQVNGVQEQEPNVQMEGVQEGSSGASCITDASVT